MSCEVLVAELPECRDDILLKFAFEPATDYVIQITDKYGHKYTKTYTSDANGDITIDTTDAIYPAGLFNRYAGQFTLKVFETDMCEKNIVLCGVEYEQIYLEFYRERNDDIEAIVQCCVELES